MSSYTLSIGYSEYIIICKLLLFCIVHYDIIAIVYRKFINEVHNLSQSAIFSFHDC